MPLRRFRRPAKRTRKPIRRIRLRKPFKRFAKRSSQFNKTTSVTLRKGVDQLFPDRMACKMKNEFAFSMAHAAGAINSWLVCANGLNAPLGNVQAGATTLTAGQVTRIYGLGNLLSADNSTGAGGPYNYYRIISAKLVCTIQAESNTSANPICCTLMPVDGNTLAYLGNINAFTQGGFIEFPYCKYKFISGLTINKGVTISNTMSTARMYGLKYRASLEDAAYSAVYNANPTNAWWWVFTGFPDTGNNTPLYVTCKMEYWIEFYNRNNLAVTQS